MKKLYMKHPKAVTNVVTITFAVLLCVLVFLALWYKPVIAVPCVLVGLFSLYQLGRFSEYAVERLKGDFEVYYNKGDNNDQGKENS